MKFFAKWFLVFGVIFFVAPGAAFGAVIINEIAWMGTEVSANDEWIELYNEGGASVNLEDWTLAAEDGSPTISLTGLAGGISAGGFFLLERSNDDSAPGATADFIYTGALGNSGEVLVLRDASGAEIGRVDAADGWLAGDNATKETMQWSGSAWVTGEATPQQVNLSLENQLSNNSEVAPSFSGGPVAPPAPTTAPSSGPPKLGVSADAGADKTIIVGVESEFRGMAFGLQGEKLLGARYLWSFGDGQMLEGKNVRHRYGYPGDYIVVLNISSGEYSAADRLLVKVVPNNLKIANVKIVPGEDTFIELFNDSNREINISFWQLSSNKNFFTFPNNTIIGARSKIIFPYTTTKLTVIDKLEVQLLYPNGSVANSFMPQIKIPVRAKVDNQKEVEKSISSRGNFVPLRTVTEKSLPADTGTKIPARVSEVVNIGEQVLDNKQSNILASVDSAGVSTRSFIFIAIGLGLLAFGALFFIRRQDFS